MRRLAGYKWQFTARLWLLSVWGTGWFEGVILYQLLVVLASYFQTSLWLRVHVNPFFNSQCPPPQHTQNRSSNSDALALLLTYYICTAAERWKVQKFGGDKQNTHFVFLFLFSNLNWQKNSRSTNTPSSAGPAVVLSRSQTVFFWWFFIVPIFGFLYWFLLCT